MSSTSSGIGRGREKICLSSPLSIAMAADYSAAMGRCQISRYLEETRRAGDA